MLSVWKALQSSCVEKTQSRIRTDQQREQDERPVRAREASQAQLTTDATTITIAITPACEPDQAEAEGPCSDPPSRLCANSDCSTSTLFRTSMRRRRR